MKFCLLTNTIYKIIKLIWTLIDLFYCSSPEKVTSSYELLSEILDHFPKLTKLEPKKQNK